MSKYNHLGEDEEQDTERSLIYYSDLFTALSFCFLFLYVASILQSSVKTFESKTKLTKEQKENQIKIQEVINKYEKMIAAYQLDKDAYLNGEATPEENKAYKEAISKLEVLAEEKKEKKDILLKELADTEVKEKALNDYQKLVKNIIDSNLALKKRVSLKEVKLDKSKIIFEQKIKEKFSKDYSDLVENSKLESTRNLEVEKRKIQEKSKQEYLSLLAKEKIRLKEMTQAVELQKTLESEEIDNRYRSQVLKLQSEKKLSERAGADLKNQIATLQMEKTHKINELEQSYGAKYDQLKKKESELLGQVHEAQSKASKAQNELKTIYNRDQVIKELVGSLKKNFIKNGVEATVDSRTGEVTLKFLQVYFDQGKSALKDEMKPILDKFMPAYTQSLFSIPNFSEKIESIEVIGFASPTFDKKYIDPKTLKVSQLPAVSYNLDLSYKRAKSIFEYIFNPKKINYQYQNDAFQISKVSGRSFLDGKEIQGSSTERVPASSSDLSTEQYCQKYNCNSQQKVVIRFHLKQ